MMPHIWVPNEQYRSIPYGKLVDAFGSAEQVERVATAMVPWYGPAIPVCVPGRVYALKGGDFVGELPKGRLMDMGKRWWSYLHNEQGTFTSLSDLIAEASARKRRTFKFLKVGPTGVVNVSSSTILLGTWPPAAANAPAAPGGEAPTDATTGFHPFTNPTGPDTQHLVNGQGMASVINNTCLVYDCIFRVNKTMNSTATEAVTGVPTRYQSTVGTAADYAGGNFLFVQVGLTALAATAHNWTVCLYTDQAGAASTLPSLTGNASAIVHRLDHPVGQWFAPLEAADVGIQQLDQMQASALVATGVINFVMGHPLGWMVFPVVNTMFFFDWINTIFNLARVFDDAALAILEVNKPATGATTYNLLVDTVAG
jgi:hypothetical protein